MGKSGRRLLFDRCGAGGLEYGDDNVGCSMRIDFVKWAVIIKMNLGQTL